MQNNKHFFGIGGEIGAGKSVLTKLLQKRGAVIISADDVVRELYHPGENCYKSIVKQFGKQILDNNGEIDRKKFAGIIFENEEKRQECNRIVHPYVYRRMLKKARQYLLDNNEVIIFEVPLLLESNFYRKMHKNIIVTADFNVRLNRIMERNKLTKEEALQKMNVQIPQSEQILIADYVIENNGNLSELDRQAEILYQELKADVQ